MRILTPSKLREILSDPLNSTAGGHTFDLTRICECINSHCAGPSSTTPPPHEDDGMALVAKA